MCRQLQASNPCQIQTFPTWDAAGDGDGAGNGALGGDGDWDGAGNGVLDGDGDRDRAGDEESTRKALPLTYSLISGV